MADNSGAFDLSHLSQAEREAVESLAEEQPEGSYPGDQNPEDNKRKVLTAFVVVVGYDGDPEVMAFEDPNLLVQSQPTTDLVYGACLTVIKDLEVQDAANASAQATAQLMMMQARAMAEQQQAAHIAANLRGM